MISGWICLARSKPAASEKAEEHGVVDHVVERQTRETIPARLVDDVVRALIDRTFENGSHRRICIAGGRCARCACRLAADRFDRGDCLGGGGSPRAPVLSHAVLRQADGDFVTAPDRGAQCLRIELASPTQPTQEVGDRRGTCRPLRFVRQAGAVRSDAM
jgi:hypothetical protein